MYILPGALAPLARYAQFILVKLVPVPGDPGKFEKFPCDYRTGQMTPKDSGGAFNSDFWMTLADACRAAAAAGPSYCVGFVITENDPFACTDMDDCAAVMGDGWIPEVQEVLDIHPGGAVEVSLSGRGLHVWSTYTGAPPEHGMKSDYKRGKKWLEFYTEKRFIALGSTASGKMIDITAELPAFVETLFPPRRSDASAAEGWQDGPCEGHTLLTDDQLITRAKKHERSLGAVLAFQGAKPVPHFTDMWEGNVKRLAICFPPLTVGKDFDGSDADFALAKDLAYWTGRDHTRIERLMQLSALKRDKWEERRRNGTYLQETILEACARCMRVYYVPPISLPAKPPPGAAQRALPKVIKHSTFVAREEMVTLFDGCVYVQDQNKILLANGDLVDQPRFKAKFAGRSFAMDNTLQAKPTKDAWEAFLSNEVIEFPRVEGTTFEPRLDFQQVVERDYRQWINVYRKPEVDMAEGDTTRFMELLYKILPKGDDAIILLSYMAAVVQYPGVKFRWAPFIQGTQGNGKSTLVECLKYALGRKYIFSVKSKMITNDFNAWLEHNILYIADDIYSTADRNDIMEALKSLITDGDQPVTLKGIDSILKRIVGNFIFTDNHKDAMKKQDDSRRICTLYSAQQSKWDRRRDGLTESFFVGEDGFVPWLNNGGYSAVAYMLHTMDIDPRYNPAGNCQEAPETSATREAIIDGRTQVEHDVAEWIELEEQGFCGDFVSFDMLKRKMSAIPAYSRSMAPLKIKEMLARLGYEVHRALPDGRTVEKVQPDDKRAILYVQRESWVAELEDAPAVAALYVEAQKAAQVAAVKERFLQGGE
jgi:hypothetical protein